MDHSTLATPLLATLFGPRLLPLLQQLAPLLQPLGKLIETYLRQPISPSGTCAFERALQAQSRGLNRTILEWVLQQLEPEDSPQCPARLHANGEVYRRRGKHPNTLASLFGPVTVPRFLYEPLEPGEPCIHPLEIRLGIEAGCATPALADRVSQWAAQHPQRTVCDLLEYEHDVHWSCTTLRKVTASLRDGLEPQRQPAQVAQVLKWLRAAQDSRGRHRPVLAAGRDGIHVPLRREGYREGAVATLSVFDRRGRRLGTVYLGRMPEEGQLTLSAQLTALLQAVLAGWEGALPRLAYITDAGWHPTDYYRRVLRKMEDPRHPGRRLAWERILDYYHASEYIGKLVDALFGVRWQGRCWGRRMRKLLKEPGGLTRVLQSAAYQRNQRKLSAAAEGAFVKAYRYLQKRGRLMDYARYRREGLPIGSGVTEAACKTVFTQRLKQSGMAWNVESGQVIVDLRVLWLSGVWKEVHERYLRDRDTLVQDTMRVSKQQKPGKAA